MALEPQKVLRQLALTPLQHRDGRVIVADPLRYSTEALEGPAMTHGLESLRIGDTMVNFHVVV